MSRYAERIADLHERARRDERSFSPPGDPPAEDEAMRYLREGFGEAVTVYLNARTGGQLVRFETEEFERLQGAMNTWLSLYARCYGVEVEPDYTVRTAAEVLIDTHDLRGTARVLTHVPPRGTDAEPRPRSDSEPTPADGPV